MAKAWQVAELGEENLKTIEDLCRWVVQLEDLPEEEVLASREAFKADLREEVQVLLPN